MDINGIHEMLEKLVENANAELDKGLECVDTCEMSKVVDMIKDLSEALYRRVVTEAMQNDDDGDDTDHVHALSRMVQSMSHNASSWKTSVPAEERSLLKQRLQSIIQEL